MTAAVLAVCFANSAAMADDPSSPADRLAKIKKEVAEAEREFHKTLEPLKDDEVGRKQLREASKVLEKAMEDGFGKAFEIAKADPTSSTAYEALEWLLTTPRLYGSELAKPAIELLTEHHAAEPRVGKVAALVGYFVRGELMPVYQPAMAFLRSVAEKNTDRTARGQALIMLALQEKLRHDRAERSGDTEAADRLAADAERQFVAIVNDYADCPRQMRGDTITLGEMAESELNELRNLRRGKPTPEIEAEDLDGEKFKLTDQKGKVVLLVFWAGWCGPCMADVPHERELVEKFKDRPFVLVGVNGDGSLEAAKQAIEKAEITWRSFWNGEQGPGGPIAKAWNVSGWPTTYVIDHTGTIRHKHLRGELLDEPLEKLVAVAEAAR